MIGFQQAVFDYELIIWFAKTGQPFCSIKYWRVFSDFMCNFDLALQMFSVIEICTIWD